MITIVSYQPEYHEDFRRLNMPWLEEFNLMEPHDLEVLDDPEGTVLAGGGQIFFAKDEDRLVGSAGLWKENEEEYELVKMAVDPDFRGKGISKLLMDHCISEVKKLKARKLFLYSNSQLTTALKLYEKYGFQHVDPAGAPFLTADVKMELIL